MKWAQAELLAAALWLAPVAAQPEPAPDLELLEFLGEDVEALDVAEAEVGDEATRTTPRPDATGRRDPSRREPNAGPDDKPD
jgi:hypothetical protein